MIDQRPLGMNRSFVAFLALLLITSTVAVGYAFWSKRHFDNISNLWGQYSSNPAEKALLLNKIKQEVGFNGLIHNYKNYLIRHTPQYQTAAEENYRNLTGYLDRFDQLPNQDTEVQSLSQIRATIQLYSQNLAVISHMIEAGDSISEIDQTVRIDDTPIIRAINDLQSSIEERQNAGYQTVSDELLAIDNAGTLVIGLSLFIMIATLAMFFWGLRVQQQLSRIYSDLDFNEKMYRNTFMANADALISLDGQGRIIDFNAAASKMFGYAVEEVLNQNVNILMHQSMRQVHDQYLANSSLHDMRVIENVRGLEAQRKNGELFPIELNVSAFNHLNRKIYVGTIRDISARVKAEKELINAKRHAEQALRSREMFFNNINHELRTPLNAIIGFSQVIASETFGPMANTKYKEYTEDIHNAGQHLLALINDILDIAKIEDGKFELYKKSTDLSAIITESVKILMENAHSHQVTLQYKPSKRPITLLCDPLRIKQVLLNLISNAIKFTPENGKVIVTINLDDEKATIKVADTGIGVAAGDIDKILRPFEQAQTERSTSHQGTGLGLPLAKNLVELHGGDFQFDSILDQGTTVTFTLPLHPETIGGGE